MDLLNIMLHLKWMMIMMNNKYKLQNTIYIFFIFFCNNFKKYVKDLILILINEFR